MKLAYLLNNHDRIQELWQLQPADGREALRYTKQLRKVRDALSDFNEWRDNFVQEHGGQIEQGTEAFAELQRKANEMAGEDVELGTEPAVGVDSFETPPSPEQMDLLLELGILRDDTS